MRTLEIQKTNSAAVKGFAGCVQLTILRERRSKSPSLRNQKAFAIARAFVFEAEPSLLMRTLEIQKTDSAAVKGFAGCVQLTLLRERRSKSPSLRNQKAFAIARAFVFKAEPSLLMRTLEIQKTNSTAVKGFAGCVQLTMLRERRSKSPSLRNQKAFAIARAFVFKAEPSLLMRTLEIQKTNSTAVKGFAGCVKNRSCKGEANQPKFATEK